MASLLEKKLERWEHELLDLGKRNKMLHYKETKRSNLKLTSPTFDELWNRLIVNEEELTFKRPIDQNSDLRVFSLLSLLESLSCPIPVIKGDIDTETSIIERQKTLKSLRAKSKLALDEQGTNILYLSVGFIEWREETTGGAWVKSPLIMVPVSLTLESSNAPYVLKRYDDDDIVINPTLTYYLEEKRGISLPTFDADEQELGGYLGRYLNQLEAIIDKCGWKVIREANLGLLSFQKINMYHDIQNNRDRLLKNSALKAISGGEAVGIDFDLQKFSHDSVRSIDTYLVVDSDSSQKDAIVLSQKGVSFVIQGPPGTGKSQTITNIIATALAEGKKVLFVSEKNAALQVVYKRLQDVNLADFCLPLHSHKANKKEILEQIGANLDLPLLSVKDNVISKLYTLDTERDKLNRYALELHSPIEPLGESIYSAYGQLNKLLSSSNIQFSVNNISEVTKPKLEVMRYAVGEFSSAIKGMGCNIKQNPWRNTEIKAVTNDLIEQINSSFPVVSQLTTNISAKKYELKTKYIFHLLNCFNDVDAAKRILSAAIYTQGTPLSWIKLDSLSSLILFAKENLIEKDEYYSTMGILKKIYNSDFFDIESKALEIKVSNYAKMLVQQIKEKQVNNEYTVTSILKKVCILIDELDKTISYINFIQEKTGYDKPIIFDNLSHYTCISGLICSAPKLNQAWFTTSDILDVRNKCIETKDFWKQILNLQNSIIKHGKKEFLSVSDFSLLDTLKQFNSIAISMCGEMNNDINTFTIEAVEKFLTQSRKDSDKLNQILSEVMKDNQRLTFYGFNPLNQVSEISNQKKICEAATKQISPLANWIGAIQGTKDYELLCLAQEHHNKVSYLQSEVLAKYEKDIFDLDSASMLIRFRTEYGNVFKWFKSSYRNDRKKILGAKKDVNIKLLDSDIIELLQNLKQISESNSWIKSNKNEILSIAGTHYIGAKTNWDELFNSIKLFNETYKLFENTENAVRAMSLNDEKDIKAIKAYQVNLSELEKFISNQRKGINTENLLDYKNQLEELSKQVEEFNGLYRDALKYVIDQNISYSDLIKFFENVREYKSLQNKVASNGKILTTYFDSKYNNEKTDWDSIIADIDCFIQIREYFPMSATTNTKIEQLLLSEEVNSVFKGLHGNILDSKPCIDSVNMIFSDSIISNRPIVDILNKLREVKEICLKLESIYKTIRSKSHSEHSWEEIDKHLEMLSHTQSIVKKYSIIDNKVITLFMPFFNGIDTDWKLIVDKLSCVDMFKELVSKYSLSNEFVKAVYERQEMVSDFEKTLNILNRVADYQTQISFVSSLFNKKFDLGEMGFDEINLRLSDCLEKLPLLEKQIDYNNTRDACINCDLEPFVTAIESRDDTIEDIIGAFMKGFHKKWIDYALTKVVSVSKFMARVQNDRIERFCSLDEFQLNIAKMRIGEKIISTYPSRTRLIAANDELSVLHHELGKKKRHMALRKLFRSIPNLLLRLKPCLMMSPLSVSYFLEAETYQFDMVIFDEASQIFPQDAIGAICRGKQVIIAGDSKQLPPSNFFRTNSSGVYDGIIADDDSDEDEIISDSILEEARNLPTQPLLWHYRSKHESLIAFSNKEIYKNKLITFPSSMSRAEDMGVEYVYVDKGVYESQINVKEAEQIVQLILEHIRKNPNRSLGIISFSEKQQMNIEDHVERFRASKPQYEWFFDEERNEPFFVKNLENVQGDERDTIIFSICYAKNNHQKNNNLPMAMRFGPLGHSGGERRLNVAITRSKYNIKLVGSILPTDIDLNRTDSEGVKMLRSYIEFAMRDSSTVIKPFHVTVEDDDLFCNTVAKFLSDQGYKVYRKIGFSDYTVDIGIESPAYPGYFAVGIECDGNMYVHAKTASDRDRLRTKMLKSMGWNLYRVWSTDWIRNPQTATAALLSFVEESLKKPINLTLRTAKDDIGTTKFMKTANNTLADEITEVKKTIQMTNDSLELSDYTEAYWRDVVCPHNLTNRVKIETLIKYVVKIEQPIHKDLIYQRLAGVFGNQKVTSIIRNSVDPVLSALEKNVLKNIDNFYVLSKNMNIQKRKAGGRSIEHISILEISATMTDIVKSSFGISEQALGTETTRLFGFDRKGPRITLAMKSTIDSLKTKGIIKIIDDKIQVVED